MPAKRGRPPSIITNDLTVLRRREKTAARVREYYARRRATQAVNPTSTEPTPEQLQQGESIVDLPSAEHEAASTLLQLGLRVQGVTLAQDAEDARLQQDATHVDEHDTLYDNRRVLDVEESTETITRISPNRVSNSTTIGQQSISRFFTSHPPTNPLSSQSIAGSINPPPPRNRSIDERGAGAPQSLDREEVEDNRHDSTVPITTSSPIRPALEGQGDGEDREDLRDQENRESRVGQDDQEDRGRLQSDHEESSYYSFDSERSEASDDDSSVEVSATAYTTDKLYRQLQEGFHGCSEEKHENQLREHLLAAGENHHSLDEVSSVPDFPSVLPLSDFISAERLARQATPSAAQWQTMFCGTIAPSGRPMNVCLHKEETQAIETQVAFDIDSFLGFARSLAVARQGIWYQPAPQMRHNMTKDNHIQTTAYHQGEDPEEEPRARLAMLRDVPHFLLGRVVGAHNITVHILFPHIDPGSDRFQSLSHDRLARWLDRIFHPAVYGECDAHVTQHLSSTYRHALADSKAHQVEGRLIETASYQAQQSIEYHLQPEYLETIWADVLQTIDTTPGLHDFREPQIFFSAKGTKLQFKTSPSRPTLFDAMENFQSYFERVMDLDLVDLDRFYVDIGKEICPRITRLPTQTLRFGEEPQVYGWKRCCLQSYLQWMYDGRPPSSKGPGQRFYEQGFLREMTSLTSLTPKQSRLREGGLIYSQFYSSVKEVWDAMKCMPFTNDGLEEMALDPQIRQSARRLAGGHRRDFRIIERAYLSSKSRTCDALQGSMRKSFGIREEHRISWALFQSLLDQLEPVAVPVSDLVLDDCPSYAWAIRTQVYLNYLWRHADKFATGFEVVRARCRTDLVTWEQTKLMAMFLRCLRFVFGGHQLHRESALWWSRRERVVGDPPQTRIWYGLGFSNTLARYRYCWLEPRIDWERLVFDSRFTDQMLFGNNVLRGQYLRRGGQVQDFFHITRRMELALEWIGKFSRHERIRDRLISWMIHLCFQQFRVDILTTVQGEIREEHREEALRGDRPFSYEYLEEIMSDGVYLLSGNRCDFKQPSSLGVFLFGIDDGRIRAHWEDRPFRTMYRRAKTSLSIQFGARSEVVQMFSRRFWRSLYGYHWILPYPCPEGLMQTTKQGQRMWYSIQPEGIAAAFSIPLDSLAPTLWQWSRKSWRTGQPAAIPGYVGWEQEEWLGWIERHRIE